MFTHTLDNVIKMNIFDICSLQPRFTAPSSSGAVWMRAVVMADARLDYHDGMLSNSSSWAAEGHEWGRGAVRAAAASIRTRSTEQRPVGASAEAA